MHCWARYLFIAVVAVLGIGQMIAACGQKGDLYLPEPETGTAGQPQPKKGEEQEADAGSTDVPAIDAGKKN